MKRGEGEIVRPPIVIVVQATSTAASLTARQTVKLGDVGSAESVFTWPDNESRSKPIKDLDGQIQTDADGKPLELTRDKKGVVSVDWSTERFSRMNPIDISVTVNRPGALRPGVYRADIWADLNSEADAEGNRDELSRPLKLRWPVFIFVQGRSVRSIAFDDPKPRVGRGATVKIELETVGCDLGEGRLQVDAGSSEQDLQLGLHVLLNQANFKREFIDPERVFYKDKFQKVNENWRLSALRISNKPLPVKSPPELAVASRQGTYPKLERHQIQVAAGDFYQPGLFQARLDWPQADVAPTQPRVALQKSINATVLPGIRVFPRQAAELEGIAVLVVADGGLPQQFQLIAAGPNSIETPIQVNEVPASSVAGQTVHRQFYGHFQTTQARGTWTIGWPRQDQRAKLSKEERQTYEKLEAQVGQPTAIDVCYQSIANLASPLEVFASAEPIWWPFYTWNPLKATGWQYTRPKAVEFAAHPNSLRLAQLTQAGWLEVLADGRRIPYDAVNGTGPKLAFQASGANAAGAQPVWKIPDKGALALDANVSLHPKEPPNPERHKLGYRQYVWCAVLTGQDSNNRSVARIIEIPVNVIVTTSWYYDWYLVLAVGVLLAIIAAWVVIRIIFSPRGKKGASARRAAPRGKPAAPQSSVDKYFGDSQPQGGAGPNEKQLERERDKQADSRSKQSPGTPPAKGSPPAKPDPKPKPGSSPPPDPKSKPGGDDPKNYFK